MALIPTRTEVARAYFWLLESAGAASLLMRDAGEAERLVILNLHSVCPNPNPFWSPLHPSLFAELLAFIAPRFEVTTFAGLQHRTGRRPPLVLSFDDGFHDFVEYAAPVLAKYGMHANQNVIGQCAMTGLPPVIVRLNDFLGAAPRSLLDEIRLPGFTVRLTGDSDDERTRFGLALAYHMKMRPSQEAARDWQTLEGLFSRLDFASTRMMSIAEIRLAASEGHEIGSHSFGHESMAFETDAFFAADFARSAEFFRERLELPLAVYAFPNASWRASHLDFLERRGVAHALLVGETYSSTSNRVHARFNHYSRSPSETHLRACGYASPGALARSAWRSASSGFGGRAPRRPVV